MNVENSAKQSGHRIAGVLTLSPVGFDHAAFIGGVHQQKTQEVKR